MSLKTGVIWKLTTECFLSPGGEGGEGEEGEEGEAREEGGEGGEGASGEVEDNSGSLVAQNWKLKPCLSLTVLPAQSPGCLSPLCPA